MQQENSKLKLVNGNQEKIIETLKKKVCSKKNIIIDPRNSIKSQLATSRENDEISKVSQRIRSETVTKINRSDTNELFEDYGIKSSMLKNQIQELNDELNNLNTNLDSAILKKSHD